MSAGLSTVQMIRYIHEYKLSKSFISWLTSGTVIWEHTTFVELHHASRTEAALHTLGRAEQRRAHVVVASQWTRSAAEFVHLPIGTR